MALTVGDREVRLLTADEIMGMVGAGILSEDEPVELLHGVLTVVSAKSPADAEVASRLLRWAAPLIVTGTCDVRVHAPLVVPDRTSLPEPDVAVVVRDDTSIAHPRTAVLVIEVAVSSLTTDTKVKPRLYAAAGVPELWVVDVTGRCVRVLTEPSADGYAAEHVTGQGEVLQPSTVDLAPLAVSELLAGI